MRPSPPPMQAHASGLPPPPLHSRACKGGPGGVGGGWGCRRGGSCTEGAHGTITRVSTSAGSPGLGPQVRARAAPGQGGRENGGTPPPPEYEGLAPSGGGRAGTPWTRWASTRTPHRLGCCRRRTSCGGAEQGAGCTERPFLLLPAHPTICWEAASSRKPSLTPLHALGKPSAPAPRALQAGTRPPLGSFLSWPGWVLPGRRSPPHVARLQGSHAGLLPVMRGRRGGHAWTARAARARRCPTSASSHGDPPRDRTVQAQPREGTRCQACPADPTGARPH